MSQTAIKGMIVAKEVGGIEMGVLEDGTPFLTGAGLAKAAKYGERRTWEHNYPDNYPQAASNPQEILVYPREALGAFRAWLEDIYIPEKFPKYVETKVKKRQLGRADADRLLAAILPAQLSDGDDDDE